jgi:hypothetical protein
MSFIKQLWNNCFWISLKVRKKDKKRKLMFSKNVEESILKLSKDREARKRTQSAAVNITRPWNTLQPALQRLRQYFLGKEYSDN